MSKKLGLFFDEVAKAIGSLAAVILVMFANNTALIMCSQTFLYNVLPNMGEWKKVFATWFFSMAWDSTVLITTANTHLLGKTIPKGMALCSGLIAVAFMDPFDPTLSVLEVSQRVFLGCLFSFNSYTFAELYCKKLAERVGDITAPIKLVKAESRVVELESRIIQVESENIQLKSDLNQKGSELAHFKALDDRHQESLICPYCSVKHGSPDSLRVHKGKCPKNPKHGIELNGHLHM